MKNLLTGFFKILTMGTLIFSCGTIVNLDENDVTQLKFNQINGARFASDFLNCKNMINVQSPCNHGFQVGECKDTCASFLLVNHTIIKSFTSEAGGRCDQFIGKCINNFTNLSVEIPKELENPYEYCIQNMVGIFQSGKDVNFCKICTIDKNLKIDTEIQECLGNLSVQPQATAIPVNVPTPEAVIPVIVPTPEIIAPEETPAPVINETKSCKEVVFTIYEFKYCDHFCQDGGAEEIKQCTKKAILNNPYFHMDTDQQGIIDGKDCKKAYESDLKSVKTCEENCSQKEFSELVECTTKALENANGTLPEEIPTPVPTQGGINPNDMAPASLLAKAGACGNKNFSDCLNFPNTCKTISCYLWGESYKGHICYDVSKYVSHEAACN